MSLNRFKIRNLFKKDMRPRNIIKLFIFGNISLLAVVAIIWLYPVVSSWLNVRNIISRQQQVYAVYLMQVREYPDLQLVPSAHHILSYAYLTATLDEVQSLAWRYGLETAEFRVSEPVGYNGSDEGGFVELIVIAQFNGQSYKISAFTYELANTAVFVRNMRVDMLGDELVNLRVEFSLFGRGE